MNKYWLFHWALPLAILTIPHPITAQVSSTKPTRRVALLVGVNSYQNRNLSPLKFAERDVTELGKVLKQGGFEVRVLTDKQSNAGNYHQELKATLSGVTRNDLLLLAFSGHGVQVRADGMEQPFFCPFDAVPSDPSTLVALSGVIKMVDARGAGTNLILVDACRDINDANRGARSGIDGDRVENLPPGTALFFSCSSRQRAMETSKAGGGHGVFFHSVLEGLRGAPAAKDEKGNVTWDRLTSFVKEHVEANTTAWFSEHERQVPHKVENLTRVPPLMVSDSRPVVKPAPEPRIGPKPRLGEKLGLLKAQLQKDRVDSPNVGGGDALLEGTDRIFNGVLNIIRDQAGNSPGSSPKPTSGNGGNRNPAKPAAGG